MADRVNAHKCLSKQPQPFFRLEKHALDSGLEEWFIHLLSLWLGVGQYFLSRFGISSSL